MAILNNKTKIVSTIGPACNSREGLTGLIEAGADVFRLNFSHGSHQLHAQVIEMTRSLNEELNTHIALLQDLQGPKIRVEEVAGSGIDLVVGQMLTITTETIVGEGDRVSTGYRDFARDVAPGDPILIDDGKIELVVEEVKGEDVRCRVIYGGLLKSRKGINLPKSSVSAPSLTEKDHEDLLFGLDQGVDWVALSFVRQAADLDPILEAIAARGSHTKVIAKIEKPQAVSNIDEIIAKADGIMVARGDLGVEMPMENVPLIQKMIVAKCNAAGKPVIVATQMLESMIENPRPTRAEATDVANAVLDGADAVMLSGETAAGRYPQLAVSQMISIIKSVEESDMPIYFKGQRVNSNSDTFLSDSVILSASRLVQDVEAKAICTLTSSGYSAVRASHHRPNCKIYALTRHRHLLTQLNLLWGVTTIYYEREHDTDETVDEIRELLKARYNLTPGDLFVILASLPLNERRRANMIKLSRVR